MNPKFSTKKSKTNKRGRSIPYLQIRRNPNSREMRNSPIFIKNIKIKDTHTTHSHPHANLNTWHTFIAYNSQSNH